MASVSVGPGPSADAAFRLGVVAAVVLALVVLGTLYSAGMVTTFVVGFAVLVVFPVYLLFVASALSVWLGFDKGVADLRRVTREQK